MEKSFDSLKPNRGDGRVEFQRIKRLPPYVFSIIDGMKMEARHRGEDIVDFGMGNPDLPTPPHVVAKLIEAAAKPANHRYSVSRGIYKLRVAIAEWYKRRYQRRHRSGQPKPSSPSALKKDCPISPGRPSIPAMWCFVRARPIRFISMPLFWPAAICAVFR